MSGPWPEADALFHQDPGWRGADAAYSVALSGDRTLWLFGDTFLGPDRRTAALVHNTIGVQDGPDPTVARLVTHHGGTAEAPTPFFPTQPGSWLWPMDCARTDAGVVVFFMQVRSARPDLPTVVDAWRAEGSLTFFEVFDWTARLIRNPDDPVAEWEVVELATPAAVDRVVPGPGAVAHEGHLYAFGWRDGHELRPGRLRRTPRYRGFRTPRRAFVARWPVALLEQGLLDPQWWDGSQWQADQGRALAVIDDPATEFTVHRDGDGFVLVDTLGWLAGVDRVGWLAPLRVLKRLPRVGRLLTALGLLRVSLTVRRAPAPQGPWTRPVRVFAPQVARDVLVYAGKAHPQLSGPGLVCTYAQIALKADRTLDDDGLYYPRFVTVPSALASGRGGQRPAPPA